MPGMGENPDHDREEVPEAAQGEADQEQREREAVYGGWRTCETVEGQGRLVDRWAERNPGTMNRSDAAIAREMLKMQRRAIERHGGA